MRRQERNSSWKSIRYFNLTENKTEKSCRLERAQRRPSVLRSPSLRLTLVHAGIPGAVAKAFGVAVTGIHVGVVVAS